MVCEKACHLTPLSRTSCCQSSVVRSSSQGVAGQYVNPVLKLSQKSIPLQPSQGQRSFAYGPLLAGVHVQEWGTSSGPAPAITGAAAGAEGAAAAAAATDTRGSPGTAKLGVNRAVALPPQILPPPLCSPSLTGANLTSVLTTRLHLSEPTQPN